MRAGKLVIIVGRRDKNTRRYEKKRLVIAMGSSCLQDKRGYLKEGHY